MLLTLFLVAGLGQVHVAGRHVDVFGAAEAAEKAKGEADAAGDRFQALFGAAPWRGAVVLTQDGRPAKDAKGDLKYLAGGARWIFRWEPGKGNEPDETMTHELGHLWLIFWMDGTGLKEPQYGSSLPDWLDEGVANLLEGPRAHAAYRGEMRRRVAAGTHQPLAELFACVHPISRQKTDKPKAADRWLFYAQTHSITAYLAEGLGPEAFRHVVTTLKQGKGLEAALGAKGLPKSVAELESAWKAWVAKD